MNKKILIGSIIAVALLTLVSFSSAVGYRSVENNPDATPIEFELQRIRELVQTIDLRKIIVNPDAVVETLEEVSSILEEEDVRNYIEKSSEEDCGCGDESSDLEGGFPVICTLLLVPLFFSVCLFAIIQYAAFPIIGFFLLIGMVFNCSWVP